MDPRFSVRRLPFVALAALTMLATLPGRTVGLGLVTEPLLRDLQIARVDYAQANFVATLLGALFSFAVGPALDRLGVRFVLICVLLALAGCVFGMAACTTFACLAVFLVLVRGFGQSALSTASITMVGKRFTQRLPVAMGAYSVFVALLFSLAFVTVETRVDALGWRGAWNEIGVALCVLALIVFVSLRRGRSAAMPGSDAMASRNEGTDGLTWRQALRTPCFWVFALGAALFNLTLAGITLFNESILGELGFASVFPYAMAALMGAGMIASLMTGWVAQHVPLPRLVAFGSLLLAVVLVAFSGLPTAGWAIVHAGVYGFCGSVFTVLFFTGYARAFGRTHLGRIQGIAQVLATFASALGPWLFAATRERSGSYFTLLPGLASIFVALAVVAWFTRLPERPGEAAA